jgi:calcineurin-like phosphoesterase family protein
LYFVSDTHFGHDNIRIYQNRPFGTVEEMDEALIARWNEKVEPDALVYHLGDFAFKNPARYARQLNGNITLIMGNHDKKSIGCYEHECGFTVHKHSYLDIATQLEPGKSHIVYMTLCHYCMMTWNKSHFGAWHLFGHTHTDILPNTGKSMNVCVGVNNDYEPTSLADVVKYMKKRPDNPNLIPSDKRRY